MKICPSSQIYIAIPPKVGADGLPKSGMVISGNCHNWNCPVCGKKRANEEYARMLEGFKKIQSQGHKLYMITLTTKGSGLSVKAAHDGYLEWTNRLLTALRKDAKLTDQLWLYVAVTEHQKRGHPHSHMLTTYCPTDLREGQKLYYSSKLQAYEWRDALVSDWLVKRCISSGMGDQYDVSPIRTIIGAAKYTAKYLFKSITDTKFPKGWKRIRYSQNFPKLPKNKSDGFPLVRPEDWHALGDYKGSWTCYDAYSYRMATTYTDRYIRYEPQEEPEP